MKHLKNESGVLLVGVIVMMIVLAIIIPAMVSYVQNESRWTIKESRNVLAFQLAEAAIDRAFRKVSESTMTWKGIQDASFPAGYMFNQSYTDVGVSGGSYTIGLSSGPEKNEVTIIGIGRYILNKSTAEVRAIKAIFINAPLGDIAIRSNSTVSLTGTNAIVHWGAVISPKAITQSLSQGTFGKYPQYYSASSVSMDPKGASGQPNCDYPKCHQWWSYKKDIPADPGIDTADYLDDANVVNAGCPSGGSPAASPAGSCYFPGSQTWGANNTPCSSMTGLYDCDNDRTIYIEGNLTVTAGIYIKGNLIVTGSVNLPNGLAGLGDNIDATLPRKAWMQYGNAWDDIYKLAKDDDSPAVYWDTERPDAFPGISSDHMGPANRVLKLDKVMVNGFFYVGSNLTQGSGGGDEKILGAMYVGGTVNVETNNFSVYYQEAAGEAIKTTQILLSRKSWLDLHNRPWPDGL